MKKLLIMFFTALTLFLLSACGGSVSGNYGYPYKDAEEQEAAQETQDENAPAKLVTSEDITKTIDNVEQWVEGNSVSIKITLFPEWEGKIQFAYYLRDEQEKEMLVKQGYIDENEYTFSNVEPGEYRIKYFLRYNADIKKSYYTPTLTVELDDGATAGAEI